MSKTEVHKKILKAIESGDFKKSCESQGMNFCSSTATENKTKKKASL